METQTISKTQEARLADALATAIERRLEKNPSLSIQTIANKAGVSYNTISRIVNKTHSPGLDQILKIIASFSDDQSIAEIIDACPLNIKTALKRVYQVIYEGQIEFRTNASLESALQDNEDFIIYSMAANRSGVHRKKIIELFGKMGSDRVDSMVRDGLLEENAKGKLDAKTKNFVTTLQTCKKHIPNYARFYEPAEGKNYIHTLSESVNLEGFEKLIELHQEFHKKANEILCCDQYAGDLPVFSVAFMDQFYRE